MYDVYRYIFIGGLILSLLMFALMVFIFFFLDIKSVIGDITGSDKKKMLEKRKGKIESDRPFEATSFDNDSNSEKTSRLSIQERFETIVDDRQQVRTLTSSDIADTDQKQSKKQSENCYKPINVNDPDFVIINDITYIHSNEIIQ